MAEDGPRLPLADGGISLVTCCDVIEHMPPTLRSEVLSEMRRVLADDGALIVTVPHKGLLSIADPENAKFHFPRAHKLLYTRLKGSQKYELRYGGERFGNFSSGAERHQHFSRQELTQILRDAGFEVQEVHYYTLIYPVARMALWLTEGLRGEGPRLRAAAAAVLVAVQLGRQRGAPAGLRALSRAADARASDVASACNPSLGPRTA